MSDETCVDDRDPLCGGNVGEQCGGRPGVIGVGGDQDVEAQRPQIAIE
nr:hypothetical protein [Streptomyces tsukubensis]